MTAACARLPLAIAVACALGSSGCGTSGCDPPSIPSSESCDQPAATYDVDTVEIGTMGGSGFTPLAAGDIVQPITGGQGSDMILAYLRVAGPDVPACLPQSTDVFVDDSLVASVALPMAMTAISGGASVTGEMYLIMDYAPYGHRVTIRAQVGDVIGEVAVYLWSREGVDAAADATWVDGGALDAARADGATAGDAAPDAAQ